MTAKSLSNKGLQAIMIFTSHCSSSEHASTVTPDALRRNDEQGILEWSICWEADSTNRSCFDHMMSSISYLVAFST